MMKTKGAAAKARIALRRPQMIIVYFNEIVGNNSPVAESPVNGGA